MTRLVSGLAIALLLAGCGGKPGMVTVAGHQGAGRFGFGAEGAVQPALLHRDNGSWLLAYVGTKLGGRHIFLASSADGKAWSKATRVEAGDFSDQNPALVEDAAGATHLYFASNRDGEDFELYHAVVSGTSAEAPEAVPGFSGVQDLAVARAGDHLVLATEIMGEGLFAADAGGTALPARGAKLADMGFEPAITSLPDGRTLVAYTRDGEVFGRATTAAGVWGTEASLAKGADRLREPALAWVGDRGKLVYAERGGTTYSPRACAFGADLRCENVSPATTKGDTRGPSIASDGAGKTLVAWGIKDDNGQQGVVVGPGE